MSTGIHCSHPLGFTVITGGFNTCFDCGQRSPGECVCGYAFKSSQCFNQGHLKGPRMISVDTTNEVRCER